MQLELESMSAKFAPLSRFTGEVVSVATLVDDKVAAKARGVLRAVEMVDESTISLMLGEASIFISDADRRAVATKASQVCLVGDRTTVVVY